MKFKERLLHSFIFEIFAVLITVVVFKLTSDKTTSTALGVSLVISLAAVTWNFIFNLIFDKLFTAPRVDRNIFIRILHASLFELGFLCFTVPFVAFTMDVDFVTAFFINIGITLIILVYVVIFNWIYDRVRLLFVEK